MDDPLIVAGIGILGMLALIALHIPIGVAMAIAGFIGVGIMLGWAPAITLFGTETSAHIASAELAIIPRSSSRMATIQPQRRLAQMRR